MVGDCGYYVRTEEELAKAVDEGFQEKEKVVLINVKNEPGLGQSIRLSRQESREKSKSGGKQVVGLPQYVGKDTLALQTRGSIDS